MLQSPHIHQGVHIRDLMYKVVYALVPAAIFGFWQFGLPAVMLTAACVFTAVITEIICHRINPQTKGEWQDGSALLTGLILAMSLPPHAPIWIGIMGSAIAIALGKHSYGGLGQNLFSPAMLARVLLLIAFPLEMTQWPIPFSQLSEATWYTSAADSFTGATALASHGISTTGFVDSGLGIVAGSMGETSAILLILGGLYLIYTKVIHWQLPVASLLGCLVPAGIAWGIDSSSFPPIEHLVSGGLLFGAFFIITDPVTGPSTSRGRWVYGLLFGFLVWIIRSFANYPEGVAFAVLLCNMCNPLIEQFTRPTIYGHKKMNQKKPQAEDV